MELKTDPFGFDKDKNVKLRFFGENDPNIPLNIYKNEHIVLVFIIYEFMIIFTKKFT